MNDNVISSIRQKFGITQEELAHVLGVSYTSVNAWEGAKRIPQEHMLKVLNDLLLADELPLISVDPCVPKGLTRTDAGFVSSVLDYNNLRDTAPYTHKIGRWYGSLPSFLVTDLLSFIKTDYGCPKAVLANFCGSGTIPLESAIAGIDSYGIDVNPMAVVLSKLKTCPVFFTQEVLARAFETVTEKHNTCNSSLPPSKKNLLWTDSKWLSEDVRETVKQLCCGISALTDLQLQRIFAVALASVIINYCNIDKRCTNHYVYKEQLPFNRDKLLQSLWVEITAYNAALSEISSIKNYRAPIITLGNACELPFADRSMDVIFSHPPYGTTINYYSINRVQISILECIRFCDGMQINGEKCQCEDISAGTLEHFRAFTDKWVKEAYRVLNDRGIFVTVIGDSRNGGVLSHPFTRVISSGEDVGFHMKELFIWVTNHKAGMHVKRKGNHIDHNYVIVMEK